MLNVAITFTAGTPLEHRNRIEMSLFFIGLCLSSFSCARQSAVVRFTRLKCHECLPDVGRSKGSDMAECKSSTSAMFVMAFELSKINASSAFEFRIATLALSVL
jgi:hypothetical protein